MFAPSQQTVESVHGWLVDSGVYSSGIFTTNGNSWVRFDASVFELEKLLKTEYKVYEHETGQRHIACEKYKVPSHIRPHVDIITPTIHFDTKINESRDPKKRKADAKTPGDRADISWQFKKGKIVSKPKRSLDAAPQASVYFTLANCGQFITPEYLRVLYNFSNGTSTASSYGIVEYTPRTYLQDDMNFFYSNFARQIPSGTAPTLQSIQGGVVETSTQSFNNNSESDLDLQYAIALVYSQKMTLYQTGDLVEHASFNNFLHGIDASYCAYQGGDDATGDGDYPNQRPGGYKSKDCGKYRPAAVISTSYEYSEADLSPAYEQRQCYEYMKLGMQGTTLAFSSGDHSVADSEGQCCTRAQCAGSTYNSGDDGSFNPAFPSTCPYVTSIGATQIVPGASMTAPEEACQTVIYSGGGFSNVFLMPSHQSNAVKSYFTNHKPTFTATQYNNSQTVRGYPDMAGVDGALWTIYGTSASAPTVGSIFTLINERRAEAGKTSMVSFSAAKVWVDFANER